VCCSDFSGIADLFDNQFISLFLVKTTFMKTSKSIFIAALLLSFTFSACRKKNDIAPELATMPLHCYNQEMDGDETGVDVGGSCGYGNSAPMSSSCGLGNDSVYFTSSAPSAQGKKVLSWTKTTSGAYNTYNMSLSGGGTISFRTTKTVNKNTELTVTSGPLDDNQCEISFNISGINTSCTSSSGSVQMRYNGADSAINICSGSWYYGMLYGGISTYTTLD
jgi:hypothetical protein